MSDSRTLLRLRWAVRTVLALGVAASVAGNVLHASGGFISQAIAAWSPLALLLTVELISRVPVHSRALGVVRLGAAGLIAGIAAWVSYWHMVAVAARYGESGTSAYLLPLSVDGLVVVASVCLVELGSRIRAEATEAAEPVHAPAHEAVQEAAQRAEAEPVVTRPAPARPRPRVLTAAERVRAAHTREPAASHKRIAELARVSESTVKRYRPTGSPSAPDAAETPLQTGSPELAGVGA